MIEINIFFFMLTVLQIYNFTGSLSSRLNCVAISYLFILLYFYIVFRADAIRSAAARQSILIGGSGAPVNFYGGGGAIFSATRRFLTKKEDTPF